MIQDCLKDCLNRVPSGPRRVFVCKVNESSRMIRNACYNSVVMVTASICLLFATPDVGCGQIPPALTAFPQSEQPLSDLRTVYLDDDSAVEDTLDFETRIQELESLVSTQGDLLKEF